MRKLLLCLLFAGVLALPSLARAGALPSYLANTSGMTTFEDALVNRGNMFEVNYSSNNLTAGASMFMLIDIASSTFDTLHAFITVQTSTDSYFVIYDSPTLVSSGVVINSYNMNRASTWTAQAVFYSSPTAGYGNYGVLVSSDLISGGNNGNVPANYKPRKWVFDTGRMYILLIKNISNKLSNNNLKVNFFEVDQ